MTEIAKMLVLSTGHVSAHTAKLLDGPRETQLLLENLDRWPVFAPIYYPKGEHGWIVWAGGDSAEDHTVRAYLPSDLVACIDFAVELGCEWLMFDRDADQIDGLAHYDW